MLELEAGVSRFSERVFPSRQAFFENLARAQQLEALFASQEVLTRMIA